MFKTQSKLQYIHLCFKEKDTTKFLWLICVICKICSEKVFIFVIGYEYCVLVILVGRIMVSIWSLLRWGGEKEGKEFKGLIKPQYKWLRYIKYAFYGKGFYILLVGQIVKNAFICLCSQLIVSLK